MKHILPCMTRVGAALVAAAALAGCASDREITPEQAATECRTYRNALSTQAYVGVMETCTRRLGEEFCRKCLP